MLGKESILKASRESEEKMIINAGKRRSCLFDLPYWTSLKLRHNFNVMHIEKYICDHILATFLGLIRKSKDNINARLDLEDMGIRKKLHLRYDGKSYSV